MHIQPSRLLAMQEHACCAPLCLPTSPVANACFFLCRLVNVVLFIADKLLHLPGMQALYLHHAHPQIWQWATHLFMHANWQHLSGNLFFLLTFGGRHDVWEAPTSSASFCLLIFILSSDTGEALQAQVQLKQGIKGTPQLNACFLLPMQAVWWRRRRVHQASSSPTLCAGLVGSRQPSALSVLP